MRLFFVILIVVAFLPIDAKAQQRFFSSLYDVPVMEGLIEVPEMALSYDKREGRVASSSATYDNKEISNVYQFYTRVLPQFGWKKTSDNSYLREGERLTITREWLDDAWLLTFSLEPLEQAE